MTGLEQISLILEKLQKFNSKMIYLVIAALVATFILDSLNPLAIKIFGFRLFAFQKELVEELLVIIVWLPFAYVLIGPGHIVTDIFRNRMGKRFGFVADMVTGFAVLFAAVVAFWASLKGSAHAIQVKSQKMGEVQFSLIPFYISLNISFFLFAVANILLMLKKVFCFRKG